MAYLGGTITNTVGVGLWGATARTPGSLAGSPTDGNGNWLWDANTLGVKFVGQMLEFFAPGYIARQLPIPSPNQPDGGVWMTVALEIDPNANKGSSGGSGH